MRFTRQAGGRVSIAMAQIEGSGTARTEMTAYPTLAPRLSQWLPREKVVD
jgi:hypothetical protein